MKKSTANTALPPPVLEVAAAWLARRDRGFSAVERSRFEAWRAADPDHAAAFDRLERSWGAMDRPLRAGAADEVLRGLADKAQRRKRQRARLAVTSMFAALVAGALWISPQRSGTVATNATTAVLVPARQELPDGTTIEFKESASVTFEFTATQRRVRLDRGVAHFQVAKDPARPFTVDASGIEIRAVGTAFTVDHRAQHVEVLVTEGTVAVVPVQPATAVAVDPAAAEPDVLVNVGEVVAVAVESRQVVVPVSTVAASELAARMSWRVPRLEFTGTPLAEAVQRMNQHNGVQFVIEDASLAKEQVSGLFRADRADGFVQALERGFGITAQRRGEDTILLRRER